MSVLKRNAVILAVLLFVCAAAYLNWSYNRGEQEAAALAEGSVSANADLAEGGAETAGLYFESDTVMLADGTSGADAAMAEASDYFAEARLNRAQARDSAMSILASTAGTESASQELVDDATAAISVMATYTLQEAQIENLVIAKGFSDCVAFINDGSISIAVPAPGEGLSAAAVARITDIVVTESEISADKIKIIEIK